MSDEDIKCFRCGAQPKILMNMKLDDTTIKMCPQCFADFGRFMQGYAVDSLVIVRRGARIIKEAEE